MKRELRTKSIGTKVSEAELRVLESRAEGAGVTLSATNISVEALNRQAFHKVPCGRNVDWGR
jgi:hypothetical protein